MRLTLRPKVITVFIFGLGAYSAWGFTPKECNLDHARSDQKEAEIIAVGRVVGINRIVENTRYSYEVTFHIGRILKGKDLKELKFIDGMYDQNIEDNTVPTNAGVGFTMSPMVKINGVYLIYFVKDGDRFRPRSYHYSICPVQSFVSEEGLNKDKTFLGVLEPIEISNFRKWTDLNAYLREKGLVEK